MPTNEPTEIFAQYENLRVKILLAQFLAEHLLLRREVQRLHARRKTVESNYFDRKNNRS